ncbi:hypothetical protein BGX29_002917 [Mortierella sp. GBA35]|nr:hypothetical protein BGX29_002917 [Mortierella sp. GBA35]
MVTPRLSLESSDSFRFLSKFQFTIQQGFDQPSTRLDAIEARQMKETQNMSTFINHIALLDQRIRQQIEPDAHEKVSIRQHSQEIEEALGNFMDSLKKLTDSVVGSIESCPGLYNEKIDVKKLGAKADSQEEETHSGSKAGEQEESHFGCKTAGYAL